MVSLSLFDENFDNRGFRGADTQLAGNGSVFADEFVHCLIRHCQQIFRP